MEFVWGVVSSLVASAVLLLIARARRWVAFGRPAQSWNLGRRLTANGVTNFFASRADFARYRQTSTLVGYLGTAAHRVDVAGYWLAHGNETESLSRQIVGLLSARPGLVARFALIDPDGPQISGVAEYLGIAEPELRQRLTSSLTNLVAARASSPPEVQNRFQVLVYRALPIASAIILDYGSGPTARIQLDFKPFQRPRSESFAIEISGTSALYTTCSEAWMAVIDGARPYAPAVA